MNHENDADFINRQKANKKQRIEELKQANQGIMNNKSVTPRLVRYDSENKEFQIWVTLDHFGGATVKTDRLQSTSEFLGLLFHLFHKMDEWVTPQHLSDLMILYCEYCQHIEGKEPEEFLGVSLPNHVASRTCWAVLEKSSGKLMCAFHDELTAQQASLQYDHPVVVRAIEWRNASFQQVQMLRQKDEETP